MVTDQQHDWGHEPSPTQGHPAQVPRTALPERPFDASAALSCRVYAKARVWVRQSYYSVPARYTGRRLDVALGATTVRALDGGKVGPYSRQNR